MDIITDLRNLKVTCGDIGSAFIQAITKENIYIRCGKEFGDKSNFIAITIRACMVPLQVHSDFGLVLQISYVYFISNPCRFD